MPKYLRLEIPINTAKGTQINRPKIESNKKATDGGRFL